MKSKAIMSALAALAFTGPMSLAAVGQERTITINPGEGDANIVVEELAPPKTPERSTVKPQGSTSSPPPVSLPRKKPQLSTAAPTKMAPASVCKPASAYLPLARKGETKNPTVLAERVERLLRKGQADRIIPGANLSPNQLLLAVNRAGAGVDGIAALPIYLRSLVKGDMPEGTIAFSRVKFGKGKDCRERFELDLTKGYSRSARKGEVGWYDTNTNLLILADDCSNTPLSPTKGPRATPLPKPQAAPVPQASLIPRSIATCKPRSKLWLLIYDTSAYKIEGVRKVIENTGGGGNWKAPNRLSRKFGERLYQAYEDGVVQKSSDTHKITVSYLGDGVEAPITTTTVVGGEFLLDVPQASNWRGVRVVFHPDDPNDLVSPKKSGETEVRELRGFTPEWNDRCKLALTAISRK